MQNELLKKRIGLIGGLISTIVIVAFAVYLMVHDLPQNTASWIMWTVLDALILVGCVAAGNKRPWLPAGFTLGALLVTIILLGKGTWHWGLVEMISAIGMAVAVICWWRSGPKLAIVACMTAMTIAAFPAMYDAWLKPNSESWWLWAGVAFSCVLSCYGAKKWTIEERLIPCGCFVLNTTMTVLVLR
ncbi:MAG: hypothetical protein U0522_02380 [Candidatus Paceibacterota bacterium]